MQWCCWSALFGTYIEWHLMHAPEPKAHITQQLEQLSQPPR